MRTLVQPEDVMKCGMCMALVFLRGQGDSLHLLAAYEDGTVALWAAAQPSRPLATVKAHAEPVMALAAMPGTLGMSASTWLVPCWLKAFTGEQIAILQRPSADRQMHSCASCGLIWPLRNSRSSSRPDCISLVWRTFPCGRTAGFWPPLDGTTKCGFSAPRPAPRWLCCRSGLLA